MNKQDELTAAPAASFAHARLAVDEARDSP
jgi:hypothetical protein